MKAMTIRLPDDLMDWLSSRADGTSRSKNQMVTHILGYARRTPMFNGEPQYTLDSSRMCSNGHHHYRQAEPVMSDFCNCGMFMFGEKLRGQ